MTSSEAQTVHTSSAAENQSVGYSYDVCSASNLATDVSASANPTLIMPPADEAYALPNGSSLSDGNLHATDSMMPVNLEIASGEFRPEQDTFVPVVSHPIADSSTNGNVAAQNEYALGEQQHEKNSGMSYISIWAGNTS